MKEFNLEEAKAGKPICTRDGKDARIVCFDAKGCSPITALVDYNGIEMCYLYMLNGRYYTTVDKESNIDLMMKSKKCKGWINVYRYKGDFRLSSSFVYKTKEEALNKRDTGYISTVEIEWEE